MALQRYSGFIFLLLLAVSGVAAPASNATKQNESRASGNFEPWQTAARRRHVLASTAGRIIFNGQGILFTPRNGKPLRWSFIQIHTFRVTPHELSLTTYSNRVWRLPGEKRFQFELRQPLPPAVAARLAEGVGRPSKNGDPDSRLTSFAAIPARHPTSFGGTNGTLRFHNGGIDYLTPGQRGSRSWRWQDIQTIALADPYRFRVGGYRETFDFELKQPMSHALFDHLWDLLYGRGLQLGVKGGHGANGSGIAQIGLDQQR